MAFVEPEASAVRRAEHARARVRSVAMGRRAVIVGGGLGGLALALRLARADWEVTIFERYSRVGGKMNLLEADGFRFDTGPSLITMPWVFEELFQAIGERLEHHVRFIPVSPLCKYTFADGTTLTMTTSPRDWLPDLRRMAAEDVPGFLRFLAMGARVLEVSRRTFFERSPWEMPRIEELGAFSRPLPLAVLAPYGRVVERLIRDRRIRQLLNRYVTYVGSDYRRAPAMLSVIPALELIYGGYHVQGGLYRLVAVLEKLCARMSVEIRLNAEVRRIHTSRGKAAAVELTSGETVPADVVIMNGDVSRVPALLGNQKAAAPDPLSLSLSGLVLLFGLRKRLDGEPHHQVFFSSDYDREFDQLFEERRFPDDPTVYVSIPTRTDPSMAPEGCEIVFVMANAPADDGRSWNVSMLGEARTRILDRLRPSGLAEALASAEVSAAVTPDMLATTFDMPGGAIYGANSHGLRAFLRPPNRSRRIRGLYCVGGSTHPGGGTPMVLLSARIVSNLIERDEKGRT